MWIERYECTALPSIIRRLRAASLDRLASHDPRTLPRPELGRGTSRPQSLSRVSAAEIYTQFLKVLEGSEMTFSGGQEPKA